MSITEKKFVTETELAGLAGKSIAAVQRWRRLGQGPAFHRIGRTPLYEPGDIETWLKGTRTAPRAEVAG